MKGSQTPQHGPMRLHGDAISGKAMAAGATTGNGRYPTRITKTRGAKKPKGGMGVKPKSPY